MKPFFVICRCDAAQSVKNVLVCVKKNLQLSSECMTAIAKIVAQLFVWTNDNNKVTKPLMQVTCAWILCSCCLHCDILTANLKLTVSCGCTCCIISCLPS